MIALYLGDKWYLDMKNGNGGAGKGDPPAGPAQCTMTMSKTDFQAMFAGKLKPTSAFMGGKLKIKGNFYNFVYLKFKNGVYSVILGDLSVAMKLEKLLKQMVQSKL